MATVAQPIDSQAEKEKTTSAGTSDVKNECDTKHLAKTDDIAEKNISVRDTDNDELNVATEEFTQKLLDDEKAFVEQSEGALTQQRKGVKGACFLSGDSDSEEDVIERIDGRSSKRETDTADIETKDAGTEAHDVDKKPKVIVAATMDAGTENTETHPTDDITAKDKQSSSAEEPTNDIVQQPTGADAAVSAKDHDDNITTSNSDTKTEPKKITEHKDEPEEEFSEEKASSHITEQDDPNLSKEEAGSEGEGNDSDYKDDGEEESSSNSVRVAGREV